MSELLEFLKPIYSTAIKNDFVWKPIHPNNMLENPISGVYTDFNFKDKDKYRYVKYSIQYQSMCDSNGLSHPELGTKYYILHEFQIISNDPIIVPEPTGNFTFGAFDGYINDYGRFRYAFDDEATAKSVACKELLQIIYPYTYILDPEELKEFNKYCELISKEII